MSENETLVEDKTTLGILCSVQKSNTLTQRGIAKELGIALGLANAYLKRCVKKGFVKIIQAPRNRYAYYLTPEGFTEKSRLTSQYLSDSFNFYRFARDQCEDNFSICINNGWKRVCLYGASDLAEIAILCSGNFDLQLIGIIDPDVEAQTMHGIAIYPDIESIESFDAIMITDLTRAQAVYDDLVRVVSPNIILSSPLLRITTEGDA
jgi:DNA-binding MarR family transcriptional regulator